MNEAILLSVRETAALLGVSKDIVYDLIKDGELNAVRLSSKCLRVRREDIDELLVRRSTARAS